MPSPHTFTHITISTLLLLVFVGVPNVASAANFLQEGVWNLVVGFFGMLAGLGGLLLDFAVTDYVVGFGKNFQASGIGAAVNSLWLTIRDIFNLTFIFGLVYLGFKMILNSDDSNTRRWLVNLIIAALLVNFSLFITKFVVEISNVFAAQIVTNGFDYHAPDAKYKISDAFMDELGVTSLFKLDSTAIDGLSGGGAWGYILGTAILLLVMFFVFAAGGVMLLIRYAVLNLYMIFSPLMFLGSVFPQLQGYTRNYWRGFLGRAFFAPIYLLLVYFSLRVINSYFSSQTASGDSVDFKGVLSAGQKTMDSFSDTLPPFVISIIFLIASIVVASKLGAEGASTAVRVGQNTARWGRRKAGAVAGGATAGMAARGYRNYVGRKAHEYTQSDAGKRRASSSLLGRQAFKTAQNLAGRSGDIRQVGNVGNKLGVGSGVAGGYAKKVADKKKENSEFLKAIETNFDENDPETRARMEQRAKEIAKETQAEAIGAETTADTIAANKDKSSQQIVAELEELNNTISQREEQLQQAKKDGTMTSDEQAAVAKEIDTDKQQRATMESTAELAKRRDSLQEGREELATRAQTDTKAREELQQRDKELEAIDKEFDTLTETNRKRANDLTQKAENAMNYAKAEMKYANELSHMKQLEKEENFWKSGGGRSLSAGSGAAGGAGGAFLAGAAGAATAGAGAAGLGIAYGAGQSKAALAQEARKDMERRFGKDGMKAAKKDQKKQDLNILRDALKEEETPQSGAETAGEQPEQPNT